MITNRLKVILSGDEADDGLRLNDLIARLDSIKNVLTELDKRVSGKVTLYYRIVGLSMSSPATIEIEAVSRTKPAKGRAAKSQHGAAVIRRLQRDLEQVKRGKRPADSDIDLLETYKSLSPSGTHVTHFDLQAGKHVVEVPQSLGSKVDLILGPDQIEYGTLVGSLEVIDIHNQRNTFRIYPAVGRSSIKCRFPSALLPEALAGINHFVRVSGELYFKSSEKFPHFMSVKRIEKMPARPADISLTAIRGMARGAFGDSAIDFVNKLRDGDDWK